MWTRIQRSMLPAQFALENLDFISTSSSYGGLEWRVKVFLAVLPPFLGLLFGVESRLSAHFSETAMANSCWPSRAPLHNSYSSDLLRWTFRFVNHRQKQQPTKQTNKQTSHLGGSGSGVWGGAGPSCALPRCYQQHTTHTTQPTTTTITQSGEARFLTGEQPPTRPGELNHALSQAQPNPSYPALCRLDTNHISMEHRPRRKHLLLNPDTKARSGIHIEKKKKKKETKFSRRTEKIEKMKKNEKHEEKEKKKEKRPQIGYFPRRLKNKIF